MFQERMAVVEESVPIEVGEVVPQPALLGKAASENNQF